VATTFGLYSFSATVGIDIACTLRFKTFFGFAGTNVLAAVSE
jgi:hypothetical protein